MIENITNYLKHTIVTPDHYQRNFENDLPKKTDESTWLHKAQRVALVALPFIAMYKPIGKTLSVGMGACRVFTHGSEIISSIKNRDALACISGIWLTAIAVVSLASSIFLFQIGLLITTMSDVAASLNNARTYLVKKEYHKAFEEILQAASSMLYLSFMLSGTLEYVLASVLLQGAINLCQSAKEWKKGRYLEFAGKFALGTLRFNQAHEYMHMIQKRNSLGKFLELLQNGKKSAHLINSPLNDKKDEVILLDADGKPYNFGANYDRTGGGLVKGMNLQFRTQVIDGKKMKEIDFKVNHVFRDRIKGLIENLKALTPNEIRNGLAVAHSHGSDIKIEKVPFSLNTENRKELGEAYKISVVGLGNILVGSSPIYPNLYDRVRVEIDEEKNVFELHELLSFLNLQDALKSSSEAEIERMKIGQLFRMFYPKEATYFERDSKFFDLPIEAVKAEIIKKCPEMRKTFENYLDKMELQEVLPGRTRFALPQIAEIAHSLGARALTSVITGAYSDKDVITRITNILKMGMLSCETRYRNGIMAKGLSSSADFYEGSADSVFTQIVTEKDYAGQTQLNGFYWGRARLLFSLKALNNGTYQYHNDEYGIRYLLYGYWANFRNQTYINRPNIFNFVKSENQNYHDDNEVMIKERIPPELINGIIVETDALREGLIEKLRSLGLFSRNGDGIESIFNIPLADFIRVESAAAL